jgi:D-lactate dehydrogenase
VALAEQHEVVCAFINDDLGAPVLERLAAGGTRLIALRSAGYNHVDLAAAKRLGLAWCAPAYSHAVAEHAVALIWRSTAACTAPTTAPAKAISACTA